MMPIDLVRPFMSDLHWIYWLLFAFCLLAFVHAAMGLVSGAKFIGYVSRRVQSSDGQRDASGRFKFQPRVVLIMPCCGVDERLHQTVQRLGVQNYEHYEVIFTFESSHDPAFAAVETWTAGWPVPRHRCVVAGPAEHRSQKVHNLLAAVAEAPAECEVLVFLDSDAVPNEDWIGHMVASLADDTVGAATGFRWYATSGGLANAVRSVWNAASVTLMEDERTRFCWGGATAIRRDRFESLEIARRWDGALTDDLQLTRAVKDAGLRIVFVPQALIPSHDQATLPGFWEFARRQLIITRVCAPEIWRSGLLLCLSFTGGAMLAAVLCIGALLGWFGNTTVAIIGGIFWGLIFVSAMSRAALRQVALRMVLGPPDLTWRDALWDVTGAAWSGVLHLLLFAASARARRIRWRHIEYEMISPSQTRVLRRWKDARAVTESPSSRPSSTSCGV